MSEAPEARDATSFLNALLLADSALPVGRFAHSFGMEAWLSQHAPAGGGEIAELVTSLISETVGPLDGAAVAHAHAARSCDDIIAVDRWVTAHKLVASLREASHACGRQLAVLAVELSEDELLAEYVQQVRMRKTSGNLSVVTGCLASALKVPLTDAVLLELRGTSAGVLSACVRLGRLSPIKAQTILRRLAPTLADAAAEAVTLPLECLHSTGPELEIAALSHRRADGRLFAT